MKIHLSSLFLILCSLVFAEPLFARWATPADTDMAMEIYNKNIEIRKNGSYVVTSEALVQATKESGKDKLVSLPLSYNARSSTLKVIEAKTIYNGKEYPIDPSQIEDKPLASSPQGFDQNNQILIAFPQMALNAKVYLKC